MTYTCAKCGKKHKDWQTIGASWDRRKASRGRVRYDCRDVELCRARRTRQAMRRKK